MDAASKPAKDTHQLATALVFACGIAGDRMLLPELTRAVRHGEFGRREKLNDAGRSHAAYALGRVTTATPARVLADVLHGRKIGGETRRGAALGLAARRVSSQQRNRIIDFLLRALETTRNHELEGALCLALGGLGRPEAVEPLMKLARNPGVRPLDREAALIALGFLGDRRDADPVYSALADFNFHPSSMMQDLMVWLGGYVLKEKGAVEKARGRR